ncbi:OmpP1/FadL family transporter [Kriegella aquimaris]|uniref:Long-chain fatty acid transport protein n=1 Tax=Kriegella aquimaris TaxID=192904 RepID=A0A1G9S5I8_9FLAO|nr:hypothetical protein [Kriegella aquimaris]SDM30769.1 hypothetical protein SAMN04488514_107118 [Kriegella aquimaris]
MMKLKIKILLLTTGLVSLSTFIQAQSEGLTSSPYSLYGLGVINQTSIGKSNGLGYTGIGLKTETEINNLNPANFALVPQNSFFYDIGVTSEYNNYSNVGTSEGRTSLNFSNFAFAFRITEGLGAGITMVPYSDVGYTLVGLQSNIEGTTEFFESNVAGIGGLSDLRLNLGYEIVDNLRLGLAASFLFGSIEENEDFQISSSSFESTETTNYNGIRMGFGLQYDLLENVTIGSTLQFPTVLNGTLERYAMKNLDGSEIVVEDNTTSDASSFTMPLEVGVGLSGTLYKSLTLSADYKKNYWSATEQSENLGHYVDQDIYAFGAEYIKNKDSYKLSQRIRYRAGFNYDTGYLAIGNTRVKGFNLTTGIGIPLSKGTNSLLNLSYSYGSKGQIQNILVKEDYHLLTLNLSLEDLWFRKRKIN